MSSRYERELRQLSQEMEDTRIFRIAGSGTGSSEFSDLIAICKGKFLVIEEKSTSSDRFYLSNITDHNMERLNSVTDVGAIPVLAIRFKRPPEWVLVDLRDFDEKKVTRDTKSDFKADIYK